MNNRVLLMNDRKPVLDAFPEEPNVLTLKLKNGRREIGCNNNLVDRRVVECELTGRH